MIQRIQVLVFKRIFSEFDNNQEFQWRGFTDLARAGKEHHFVGQIGLHTVIKVAFHAAIFRLFYRTLTNSRDFYSKY